MSFDGFGAGAESALSEAVLAVLRADAGVRELLGDPARVFDDETQAPAYPFARLERHDAKPGDAIAPVRLEHRLQFMTLSRHEGRREAKAILGAMRAAIEDADWSALGLVGQRVVVAMVTYSDAMRTRNLSAFRGVLRVKIIVEVNHDAG